MKDASLILLLNYSNVVRESMYELQLAIAAKLQIQTRDIMIQLVREDGGHLIPRVRLRTQHARDQTYIDQVVRTSIAVVQKVMDQRMLRLMDRRA